MKRTIILSFLIFSKFSYSFDLGVEIGVNGHSENNEKIKKYIINNGLNSFKTEMFWDGNLNDKDNYSVKKAVAAISNPSGTNNSLQGSLSPLIVLNYEIPVRNNLIQTSEGIDAFVNYSTYVASVNKGNGMIYEIPDKPLGGSQGQSVKNSVITPSDYYRLISLTSKAIHKVDPSAKVIAGAVNPSVIPDVKWFDKVISMGVFNYIDGVSIHPLASVNSTQASHEASGNFMMVKSYKNHLTAMNKCNPVKLYITAMQVPAPNDNDEVNQNNNERFALKYTLLTMSDPDIKGIWWIRQATNKMATSKNLDNEYDHILLGLQKSASLVKGNNIISIINKNKNVTVEISSKENSSSEKIKIYWNDLVKSKEWGVYNETSDGSKILNGDTFRNEPLIVRSVGL